MNDCARMRESMPNDKKSEKSFSPFPRQVPVSERETRVSPNKIKGFVHYLPSVPRLKLFYFTPLTIKHNLCDNIHRLIEEGFRTRCPMP